MMNTRNTIYEALLSKVVGSKMNLPMQPTIEFGASGDDVRCVEVTLSKQAVCANMQTNAAAFESWIIALKVWGVIDRAILKWDRPAFAEMPCPQWCHYQRFLYRVNFLLKLFGDNWFEIDSSNNLEECEAIKKINIEDGKLVLNVPDKDNYGNPGLAKQEALLEAAFAPLEKKTLGLLGEFFKLHTVNRQLPVGLFKGAKSAQTRIFTGGASAIDLVGLGDKNSLWMFELKKKGNSSLGVISELMFYAACMLDLRADRFKLHDGPTGKRWDGDIRDIASEGAVHAVFLLPEAHRLFRERKEECLALLNQSCASRDIDIQFHYQAFDYEFSESNCAGMPVIKMLS